MDVQFQWRSVCVFTMVESNCSHNDRPTILLSPKGFWLAATEKLYDGVTAETANVVRALAIHNSTLWKRGVHADGQKRIMRIEIMPGHTKSLDANDKLIQTRSHERDTIASRKRHIAMRKVKSTIVPMSWNKY